MRAYRSHYLRLLGPLTSLLPGAAEALAAVRAAGARAVVITAKYELTARLSLEGVGLSADELFADAHGPEKGMVLKSIGAAVYVGDTPADMAAAATAGAHAVGVTTGSFTAAELRAAGAADVLASLTDFPRPVPQTHYLTLTHRHGPADAPAAVALRTRRGAAARPA